MTFRDAPFAPSTPLFPSRRQVLDYLHAYAEQHRELLAPVTRFGTEVVGMQKQGSTWSVTSRQGQDERQEVFDKVVVSQSARAGDGPLWNVTLGSREIAAHHSPDRSRLAAVPARSCLSCPGSGTSPARSGTRAGTARRSSSATRCV
jgi:hypothetical protein